jgi:chromosome segregation ATPase
VTARAGRGRGLLSGSKGDGEVALRAEVEALNARIREQADTLDRLQGRSDADAAGDARAIARLRQDMTATEEALHEARVSAEANADTVAALEAELARLRTAGQDQAAQLASVKAELGTYRAGEQDERAIKDSRVALRAKVSALKAQTDEQSTLIQSLRDELAAANERLARQAAHFRNELRVLGSSTPQAPAAGRAAAPGEPRRRALSDRIKDPQVKRLSSPERPAPSDAAAIDPASESAGGEGRSERRPRLVERLTGLDKPSV